MNKLTLQTTLCLLGHNYRDRYSTTARLLNGFIRLSKPQAVVFYSKTQLYPTKITKKLLRQTVKSLKNLNDFFQTLHIMTAAKASY
jgi:hypothetical protein